MLTESQIQDFAEFLAEELSDEPSMFLDSIVATRSTVQEHEDAMIAFGRRRDDQTPSGVPVAIWTESQRAKGEPRKDVYVADYGDVRAAYAV